MNLSSIPVGATVADRYYEVDNFLTFPVDPEGFEDAVYKIREKYRNHPGHPGCVVDLCWDLRWEVGPEGGACGVVGMIERLKVQHLDEAHWERMAKTRDPLPPGKAEVRIADLVSPQCSFAMRTPAVAMSDCCRRSVVSAVEVHGARFYRCYEHEAQIHSGSLKRGRVRLRMLVEAAEYDPSCYLRVGPLPVS